MCRLTNVETMEALQRKMEQGKRDSFKAHAVRVLANSTQKESRAPDINALNQLTTDSPILFVEVPGFVRRQLVKLDFDDWEDLENTLKIKPA